jgi:hypothetical protein
MNHIVSIPSLGGPDDDEAYPFAIGVVKSLELDDVGMSDDTHDL